MDYKNRVYYLVNLNLNHHKDMIDDVWDSYGHIHNNNLKSLQDDVKSLKFTPNNQKDYTNLYFQRKLSCLKSEEHHLLNAFKKLDNIEYVRIY